jgi:hypothetical protein
MNKSQIKELVYYVYLNIDKIPVRENIDGKWENVMLSSLPAPRFMYWVNRWIDEDRYPYVMKDSKEE